MKKTLIATAVIAGFLSTSCSDVAPDPIAQHVDSTFTPGTNFFLYANNGWFRENPIPASEKSNGIFRTIQDTINESIKKICESSAAEKSAKGTNKQKIGDFYASGMDTVNIEKVGIKPLSQFYTKIDAAKTSADVVAAIAMLHANGVGNSYGFSVYQDDKKSSQYAAYFTQVRLSLPDRDYYFNTDARTNTIRAEYVKHLQVIFTALGYDAATAAKNASAIMKLETAMAGASRKIEDLRDPYKNYNKMDVAGLGKLAPSVNWSGVINTYGLTKVDSVVVGQPEYFTAFENLLKTTSVEDWKVYLKWCVTNHYSETLNKTFEEANFNFYSGIIDGVKERKPRWKTIVESTDNSLGELIGQVYVEEYLPKGTKEKLLEIGNNIRDVYAVHIKDLDWMSEVTKKKALSKLSKITMKVGYPDKWKDMSALSISRNSYVENAINVDKWQFNHMINKYGKPVDKKEWEMYPQTYNAYYNPANNEIVVPACNIIVPGFEGRMPDDAVLYGIIGGSTFGHEITHGFDDQGSQYDENGNLNDWWTKEDREQFTKRTRQIVNQFNKFKVLDSLHVNGEFTQGENIADLGGVVMGYEAFKKTAQGKSKELFSGYTADQRFFLAYAYAWMVNRTDASLARQIMSDVHAPAEFRINGPIVNMDEWYKAFNIKKGDKMFVELPNRITIW